MYPQKTVHNHHDQYPLPSYPQQHQQQTQSSAPLFIPDMYAYDSFINHCLVASQQREYQHQQERHPPPQQPSPSRHGPLPSYSAQTPFASSNASNDKYATVNRAYTAFAPQPCMPVGEALLPPQQPATFVVSSDEQEHGSIVAHAQAQKELCTRVSNAFKEHHARINVFLSTVPVSCDRYKQSSASSRSDTFSRMVLSYMAIMEVAQDIGIKCSEQMFAFMGTSKQYLDPESKQRIMTIGINCEKMGKKLSSRLLGYSVSADERGEQEKQSLSAAQATPTTHINGMVPNPASPYYHCKYGMPLVPPHLTGRDATHSAYSGVSNTSANPVTVSTATNQNPGQPNQEPTSKTIQRLSRQQTHSTQHQHVKKHPSRRAAHDTTPVIATADGTSHQQRRTDVNHQDNADRHTAGAVEVLPIGEEGPDVCVEPSGSLREVPRTTMHAPQSQKPHATTPAANGSATDPSVPLHTAKGAVPQKSPIIAIPVLAVTTAANATLEKHCPPLQKETPLPAQPQSGNVKVPPQQNPNQTELSGQTDLQRSAVAPGGTPNDSSQQQHQAPSATATPMMINPALETQTVSLPPVQQQQQQHRQQQTFASVPDLKDHSPSSSPSSSPKSDQSIPVKKRKRPDGEHPVPDRSRDSSPPSTQETVMVNTTDLSHPGKLPPYPAPEQPAGRQATKSLSRRKPARVSVGQVIACQEAGKEITKNFVLDMDQYSMDQYSITRLRDAPLSSLPLGVMVG